MNVLEYEYDGQIIEFDISGNDVMINATEMAKKFSKRPIDFLKQESTKAFIEVLKTSFAAFRSDVGSQRNSPNADSLDINVFRSDRGGDEGGSTWMQRQLALKFAAWLSPEFEVWIYQTIDSLVFGNLHRVNDSLKAKADLLELRDAILFNLQDNADYLELQKINTQIKGVEKALRESNNSQLDLFKK